MAIIAICTWLCYWLKILRNLSKISAEIKEKVESLSLFIGSLTTLIEKLVAAYKKKKYGGRKREKGPG